MDRGSNLADCIPQELIKDIYRNGKEQNEQHVYRVSKSGIINESTFWCSYEEYQYEDRKSKKSPDEIGLYSTSCYLSPKSPEKFLNFIKRRYHEQYPHPILIHGNTICGLSQLTKDRIPNYKDKDHVDWWIYKGNFEKIKNNFEICEQYKEENYNE
jgi:hypothetical protein